ncbi:MAG TPA: hypothetical protein DD670_20060 [Planctomycetaceae bacterium]|nr:hypothetical protein [Planctomycetaceae bacterium]
MSPRDKPRPGVWAEVVGHDGRIVAALSDLRTVESIQAVVSTGGLYGLGKASAFMAAPGLAVR